MRAPPVDLPAAGPERFLRRDPGHLPALFVTAAGDASADRAIPGELPTTREAARRAPVTRQNDGLIRQRHVLQNLSGYVRHRLPSSSAGALRGLPALVCGAGPSLEVSLPALAAAAGHAVVFSADSALRALARADVAADFAVSIEADKVPDNCLPTGSLPARVILASVSPPAWSGALLPSPPLFLSGAQVTEDWLAAQGVACTAVTAAESCGSTARALAEHLGCGPIYLFGMDLAVDSASRLATRPAGHVFNIPDRGARPGSATVVHPEQFSLPAPALRKTSLLARLAVAPDAHTEIFHRLAALGTRAEAALPGLRRAFAAEGPSGLAAAFRPLVVDPRSRPRARRLRLETHAAPRAAGRGPRRRLAASAR